MNLSLKIKRLQKLGLYLTITIAACLASHSSATLTTEPLPEASTLSASENALIAWVDQREDAILSELKEHVEMNTGTQNIDGLNTYRDRLDLELQALGFSTTLHSSPTFEVLTCASEKLKFADHLSAKREGESKIRLLLNGHMDTVFGPDDEFQALEILGDGTLKGPGVADMKGGIVIMLNALRALHESGVLDKATMTVLFNSDEEMGSLGSRSLIEELAQQHDLGLVFESTGQNLIVNARKGLGQARLRITGRESHSGSAHQEGVSANLELAHKVIAIEELTDYAANATVNVGVMQGGEKRNTISGCAEAYIDMRYPDQATGELLQDSIARIASNIVVSNPAYPGLPEVEHWSTLHRPAKDPHPTVDALIEHAISLSKSIGEPLLGTRYSGGGTDGSIAQGVGLPTFDTLGIDGSGGHSSREQASVQSLVARTKLVAVMLSRLIEGRLDLPVEIPLTVAQ